MSCLEQIEEALIGAIAWIVYHALLLWEAIETRMKKQ